MNLSEIVNAVNGKLTCGESTGWVSGVSTDTRTIKPGELFIALSGKNFNGNDFIDKAINQGARAIIAKKPVIKAFSVIEVSDTLRALQNLALYYRKKYNMQVIGVTGSNGKTTTKDMLASIMSKKGRVTATKGNLNNLIGLPMTLFDITSETKYCVLEMGTNHSGEIRALAGMCVPEIGVITNIENAHMEFFHNLKNVLKEKMELVKKLPLDGTAVLNTDNEYLKKAAKKIKCEIITFGMNRGAMVRAEKIVIDANNNRCGFILNNRGRKNKIMMGSYAKHNIYNALAACAAAGRLGCSLEMMADSLKAFRFPKMRLSVIVKKGVRIINDAYNANPSSTQAAIIETGESFPGLRKVAVLADMLELGNESEFFHRQTGKAVFKNDFKVLVTVGREAKYIAAGAMDEGMAGKNIVNCESVTEAAKELKNILKANDVVLIKGSRSMRMEKIVEELIGWLK